MKKVLIFTLFGVVLNHGIAGSGNTLNGNQDSLEKSIFTFNLDEEHQNSENKFFRRKRANDNNNTIPSNVKIKKLDDRHKQLMVHWVGEGSSVIICLARDPAPNSDIPPVNPSAVYISYDYGDTYKNKTPDFILSDGNYSTLEKFYNHPKFNTHFVFADVKHKTIFVTSDHGQNIKKIDVNFSPTDVSFHENDPSTFLVHDKNHPDLKVYLTEDFGNSFIPILDFVKSFHWMKDSTGDQQLIEYRLQPWGLGTVLYSKSFRTHPAFIYSSSVKDLFIKNDYIFTTKEGEKGNLELYVSYKFGPQLKCLFDTQLDKNAYFVVDVTGNRALVAVSHGRTVSHLYVSNNLGGLNGMVEFTLSLEDVLCYFPNNTWHDTLMQLMVEDTFADVYKVQGLSGIYIASRIVNKPPKPGNNLGPQHLGSVITFDHGATWRLIQAPQRDNEGQLISCDIHRNCSLHLSQKFSYLYPDTKTISILSSKSAPGILMATGIIGNSLKGHYGVYVSSDGGWSWRQALKELYFFNMGDHGGILTAVKYYKSRGETRHILYSTDEGKTWEPSPFNKENLRLYGLMTEPGENTTIFTMFGSLPDFHQWIIIKIDLFKAFEYNCTKADYKFWSPSQSTGSRNYVPCIMGQQRTYQRRMANSHCYNGLDYDYPISMESCSCDILDYECDFGFVHTGKFGHCVRNKTVLIDPYKVPENCPQGQFYNRTKGYRKISGDQCVAGFEKHYLPDQVPCPFNEVQDFLLFAQRERISRFNLVTKTLQEVPVKNLKNVIAIDFDMKNNCVYWADIALDIIGRQCLNGSVPEILVSSDLASIEGMAFDWIANTLYFVDGMRSKIELIRTDINHSGRMRRTVLGQNVLKKPRGIALDPKNGYLFWTDWSAENPSVNRADLDGSNIKVLFKKPLVEWPNGITIDYFAGRIYWVDARQDYIASADLHGDDMKYVIKGNEVVSHPFAVAVFKSTMFWDDWKRTAIFGADKDSSEGNLQSLEVLQKQLVGLMDLKVFAHGIQIGNNTCKPDSCPYLCVGSPSKGHVCLCPDGMVPLGNECLCPGKVKPSATGTCQKQNGTCAPEHFMCADNSCIPSGWRCDHEPDCSDGSDEVNCTTQSCPPNYFVCASDGKCIPHFWRCDYSNDCVDGSDEKDCPKSNCTEEQFKCTNNRCISLKWRCDGENDCKDNSDELNCNAPEPVTCRSDEFKCKSGGTSCIPNHWRCDRESDCRDGSDELECGSAQCSEDRFFCGNTSNTCIYKAWVCDGEKDCPDGRDENNCSQTAIPQRPKMPDLFSAQNGSCTEWMFKCRNDKCIPYWWKCDDTDDCGDGSDEQGCQNSQSSTPVSTIIPMHPSSSAPKLCGPNQFRCSSGICILNSWLCDGIKDCFGGEDETNCSTTCDAKHYRCREDGNCILRSQVCDHKKDCPDGTDELNCDLHLPKIPEAPSCAVGLFPCDGRLCLPLTLMCNGKVECPDGFDEQNCSNNTRVYQVLDMGIDEREVNETHILFFWWIAMPLNVEIDFMPSISKLSDKKWENMTWTNESRYRFTKLTPFTIYNMTVYVRNRNTSVIFPPAKYYLSNTREGIPSEPWNVTVKQLDSQRVALNWNKPSMPNGIITAYEIAWRTDDPNSVRILKLSGSNETSFVLKTVFTHNVTYYFHVNAYNRRHKSHQSEVVSLKLDQETDLSPVENFTVAEVTNSSIKLSWSYSGLEPEGFEIHISVTNQINYPQWDSIKTKSREINIDNLSPGIVYQFQIHAYKKHFKGPVETKTQGTKGNPLPEIPHIGGRINPSEPTVAKLTWERPHDDRNADWVYGVYYGIDQELFYKAKLETKNLTASIPRLGACETYTFTVGIVGPMGYGPLSHNWIGLTTYTDLTAPPKHLTVREENNNPLRMKLEWEPSCDNNQDTGYKIKTYEQNTGNVSFVKLKVMKERPLVHSFDVLYGAVYNISVSTTALDAQFTAPVTYHAPPLSPPYSVRVLVENNGSYIVYWAERDIPKVVGSYFYEVYVSEGFQFNESIAEKFVVEKPPFLYSNFTGYEYTFGVKLRTVSNLSSLMSETVPYRNEYSLSVTLNKSSAITVLICVLTLFVLLSVVIGILLRQRRRQKSFDRFANSHYDTRSGSATFDDNHGLEDEIPRIQGFSDDEPLVIA